MVRHFRSAGSHAVTVAVDPTSDLIITGSQDKALRWWSATHTNDQFVREIKNAHDDIVRSIFVHSEIVVTGSNDGSIKVWSTDGLVGRMDGHENFVFSVHAFGSSTVSSGEDRTVRVWSLETLGPAVQVIRHPGTVWFAHFIGSADRIITGCSDGIVRIFSSIPSESASDDEISVFNSLSVPPPTEGESVDPATVAPESDMPRYRGKKVGEIRMFKDTQNVVYAYQWTGGQLWEKVGLVTGGTKPKSTVKKPYSGDQYFPAGEYDFLFDVELGEARMAVLPFSAGDNPLVAAERFCAREVINKSNISQIVDFIKTNAGPAASAAAPASSSAASSSPSTSTHFPPSTPFLFKEAKWPQLLAKLKEVNASIPTPLTHQDLALIDHVAQVLQAPPSHLSPDFRPSEISVIHSKLISSFPPESLFVVFDLWRLFVLHGSATVMYKDSDGGGQYILTAARNLQAAPSTNTGLCTARYLANLFASQVSKWAAVDRANLYLPVVAQALTTPGVNKQTQLALASVIANLATATSEKKNGKNMELASTILDNLVNVVPNVTDPDVTYRLLVGVGCSLIGLNGKSARKDEISAIVSRIEIDKSEDFIRQCCRDIKAQLAL